MQLIIFGTIIGLTKSQITESKLASIMGQCNQSGEEAISCSRATPLINQAMTKYGINTKPAMAMMLSNIKIESGNMKYNKNKVPGRPGQGTRCMLMPENLLLFAKDQGKSVGNRKLQSYKDVDFKNETEQQKIEILSILNSDELSFLPCAWWIQTGASLSKPTCKNPLSLINDGSDQAINSYFTTCMGVYNTGERLQIYKEVLSKL